MLRTCHTNSVYKYGNQISINTSNSHNDLYERQKEEEEEENNQNWWKYDTILMFCGFLANEATFLIEIKTDWDEKTWRKKRRCVDCVWNTQIN